LYGGTPGHPDVFSPLPAVGRIAIVGTTGGGNSGLRSLLPRTVRAPRRPVPPHGTDPIALARSTWRPPEDGASPARTLFGPNSYGHTGFTGTSIWIDPDRELYVILLTNRVHPSRARSRIAPVRVALADAAAGAVLADADPLRSLGFGTAPDDLLRP